MKWILSAVLLSLVSACWAQKKQFVGTYEVIRIAEGKAVDNKTLPPGQVMIMELHAEGHWDMRNLLVGFDGTWHMSGKNLVLLTENGPAGKISPPEKWIVMPKPNKGRLVVTSPKKFAGLLEFHFSPKIRDEVTKRMKERLR